MMEKKHRVKTTLFFIALILFVGFYSCNTDRSDDFEDYDIDTDGDGIFDSQEVLDGTDKNNPCDPVHDSGYTSYDPENLLWLSGDCDGDGLSNEAEISANENPYGEHIINKLAVPEFLPKLSQLNLFKDDMADFQYNDNVYEYNLSTPLFTDYAYKLRLITVPDGKQFTYTDGGLLEYPNNTIMAKTFYYLNDERDSSLGKKIIETRVLIKKGGEWIARNYFWNEDQKDAVLDDDAHDIQVNWIDDLGVSKSIDYKVPSNTMCMQCHKLNEKIVPIGPKARAMNFDYNGENILQFFKDNNILVDAPEVTQIPVLPDWSDTSLPLENRARAYLDVNCAHCHQKGGSYNRDFGDKFYFNFETPFTESNIYLERTQISDRIGTPIPGYFMPLIGTSVKHDEGIELLNAYIDSLEE